MNDKVRNLNHKPETDKGYHKRGLLNFFTFMKLPSNQGLPKTQ